MDSPIIFDGSLAVAIDKMHEKLMQDNSKDSAQAKVEKNVDISALDAWELDELDAQQAGTT